MFFWFFKRFVNEDFVTYLSDYLGADDILLPYLSGVLVGRFAIVTKLDNTAIIDVGADVVSGECGCCYDEERNTPELRAGVLLIFDTA